MSVVTATTTDAFGVDVRDAQVPVLVDFWAPWCTRCRAMVPEIEAVATRYDGRAKVVTVDVEAHPLVAQEHLVLSLPAVALYQDGQVVRMLTGLYTAEELGSFVEEVLV